MLAEMLTLRSRDDPTPTPTPDCVDCVIPPSILRASPVAFRGKCSTRQWGCFISNRGSAASPRVPTGSHGGEGQKNPRGVALPTEFALTRRTDPSDPVSGNCRPGADRQERDQLTEPRAGTPFRVPDREPPVHARDTQERNKPPPAEPEAELRPASQDRGEPSAPGCLPSHRRTARAARREGAFPVPARSPRAPGPPLWGMLATASAPALGWSTLGLRASGSAPVLPARPTVVIPPPPGKSLHHPVSSRVETEPQPQPQLRTPGAGLPRNKQESSKAEPGLHTQTPTTRRKRNTAKQRGAQSRGPGAQGSDTSASLRTPKRWAQLLVLVPPALTGMHTPTPLAGLLIVCPVALLSPESTPRSRPSGRLAGKTDRKSGSGPSVSPPAYANFRPKRLWSCQARPQNAQQTQILK